MPPLLHFCCSEFGAELDPALRTKFFQQVRLVGWREDVTRCWSCACAHMPIAGWHRKCALCIALRLPPQVTVLRTDLLKWATKQSKQVWRAATAARGPPLLPCHAKPCKPPAGPPRTWAAAAIWACRAAAAAAARCRCCLASRWWRR